MKEFLDSASKEELLQKLKELFNKKAPSSMPSDEVNFSFKGHIKIETYDSDGNVLETIDQDNLVTIHAWDILTRMVANDPERYGYYNPQMYVNNSRVTSHADTLPDDIRRKFSTTKIDIYRHRVRTRESSSSSWSDWSVTYNHTYAESSSSTTREQVVALVVPAVEAGGETYKIEYIGLGTGKDYLVSSSDIDVFSFDESWTVSSKVDSEGGFIAESSTPNSEVEISFTGTALEAFFTLQDDGANLSIEIDGQPFDDVSLYSATRTRGVKRVLASGLKDTDHIAIIKHKGTGHTSGLESYVANIEAIRINGLLPSRNSLFKEIRPQETLIEVPEYYNTSNVSPYTFTLRRGPSGIKPGSEEIVYDNALLDRVDVAPTSENEYAIDYTNGKVTLFRPAMGVQATYETESPFNTEYKRAIIERPSPGSPDYPWYDLSTSTVYFTADFPPGSPGYPVRVREVALFDCSEDTPQARMFSIVRPDEMIKEVDTGLRITWEIKLRD